MNRGSVFAVSGALGVLLAGLVGVGCAGDAGGGAPLSDYHAPTAPTAPNTPHAAIPVTPPLGTHPSATVTDPGVSNDAANPTPHDAANPTPAVPGGANDAAAHCKTEPTLHVTSSRGLFCPFSKDSTDKPVSCQVGKQQCCVSEKKGGTPSTCNDIATACETAHFSLGCADSPSCGAGEICCATGPAPAVAACTYPESHHLAASACSKASTCAAGEYRLCSSNGDCATGETCSAFRVSGMQFGHCHS